MGKVLTITVPSYNVEKFLENTLNSFVDERVLNDIDVLIIDDGSKDNTAKIGKQYEEKYPETFQCDFQRKWWTWIYNQSRNTGSNREIL